MLALGSIIMLCSHVTASAGADRYFIAPPGWIWQPPTQEMLRMGMLGVWQPAKRNGENITLTVISRKGVESLEDFKNNVIDGEEQDGRELTRVRRHRTCHGDQDGFDIDFRFVIVNQLYHLAVRGKQTYALIYTHSIGDSDTNPTVFQAFDTFCAPKSDLLTTV